LSYCTDIGKLEEVAVIRGQDRKNNLKVIVVKIPPGGHLPYFSPVPSAGHPRIIPGVSQDWILYNSSIKAL
jgi:hypothetical protein